MHDKNLLVLTNGYPSHNGLASHTFVKDQVDAIKSKFNKVYVISPKPYFPKFLTEFKIVPQYYKDQTKFNDYEYDNVEVFYPTYFTAPLEYFRKNNGRFVATKTQGLIDKHDIHFDLIHTHFTYPAGFSAAWLKDYYNKPMILTTHSIHKTRIERLIKKKHAIKTWNDTDKIINVNPNEHKLIEPFIENPNKITHIPNIINLKRFKNIGKDKSRSKLNLDKDKNIILGVGNLVEKKGFSELITAFKYLNKPNTELYIVGEGNYRDTLEKKINNLKLNDKVHLIGRVPHDKIYLWMNAADVFVLNSYKESFGVVNIEALACGTPVVSTYNGGSENIITNNTLGYLHKNPTDYEDLNDNIKKALNQDWDKSVMRDHIMRYSQKNISKQLLKQYKALL